VCEREREREKGRFPVAIVSRKRFRRGLEFRKKRLKRQRMMRAEKRKEEEEEEDYLSTLSKWAPPGQLESEVTLQSDGGSPKST
jgi:hypothetical protein